MLSLAAPLVPSVFKSLHKNYTFLWKKSTWPSQSLSVVTTDPILPILFLNESIQVLDMPSMVACLPLPSIFKRDSKNYIFCIGKICTKHKEQSTGSRQPLMTHLGVIGFHLKKKKELTKLILWQTPHGLCAVFSLWEKSA